MASPHATAMEETVALIDAMITATRQAFRQSVPHPPIMQHFMHLPPETERKLRAPLPGALIEPFRLLGKAELGSGDEIYLMPEGAQRLDGLKHMHRRPAVGVQTGSRLRPYIQNSHANLPRMPTRAHSRHPAAAHCCKRSDGA